MASRNEAGQKDNLLNHPGKAGGILKTKNSKFAMKCARKPLGVDTTSKRVKDVVSNLKEKSISKPLEITADTPPKSTISSDEELKCVQISETTMISSDTELKPVMAFESTISSDQDRKQFEAYRAFMEMDQAEFERYVFSDYQLNDKSHYSDEEFGELD